MASEVGARSVGCTGLNPSTTVGWRPSRSCRLECLAKPLKDGADWLAGKLTGAGAEGRTEESGDVSIGVRIGRVGVDDVESAGDDNDGVKGFAVDVSSSVGCLGGGAPNGKKGDAVGFSVPVERRSCFSPEAEAKVAVSAPKPAGDVSAV